MSSEAHTKKKRKRQLIPRSRYSLLSEHCWPISTFASLPTLLLALAFASKTVATLHVRKLIPLATPLRVSQAGRKWSIGHGFDNPDVLAVITSYIISVIKLSKSASSVRAGNMLRVRPADLLRGSSKPGAVRFPRHRYRIQAK